VSAVRFHEGLRDKGHRGNVVVVCEPCGNHTGVKA